MARQVVREMLPCWVDLFNSLGFLDLLWWVVVHIYSIRELRRQGAYKFKASLSYTVRLISKDNKWANEMAQHCLPGNLDECD